MCIIHRIGRAIWKINRTPSINIVDMYTCQFIAIFKWTFTDTRDGVGDSYARKACAASKRITPDTRDGVGDIYARQSCAAGKRPITDTRD